MLSSVDAVIAIAPLSFIAVIAFPVASVSICFAYIAEDTSLQPLLGIVFTGERIGCCRAFGRGCSRSSISATAHYMRIFLIGGISTWWGLALVCRPRSPTEAEPMLAALPTAVAG